MWQLFVGHSDALEDNASCERLEFMVDDPEDQVKLFITDIMKPYQVIRVIYKGGLILHWGHHISLIFPL